MRQKKIKGVEQKIELFSEPLVREPASFKGRWREAFDGFGRVAFDSSRASDGRIPADGGETGHVDDGDDGLIPYERVPLNLEIGCGKGRFLKFSALKDPDSLYLGFEGQISVLYRALQMAYADSGVTPGESDETASPPDNLLICAEYIVDMRDYFERGELDGVFLNFSDPWPKTRQRKRRLTSPRYLDGYRYALKSGGFIRFKTDNADFFEYSLGCIEAHPGFELTAVTNDLHASEYAADSEMTEYERRFLNLNMRIHYLEARNLALSADDRAYSRVREERMSMRLGEKSVGEREGTFDRR
jgi:tRNA (guanine-N7-)-methyltransferase